MFNLNINRMKINYLHLSPRCIRTLLILMLSICSVQRTLAQITISVPESTLENVIRHIKAQSKYQFFYDDNLSTTRIGAINAKNQTLTKLLNKVLEGTNIVYKIDEDVVYLSKKKEIFQTPVTNQKQQTIKGKVVDSQGEALIGVSVLEKGTTNGTITDFDGKYTLVSNNNAILQFSYVGYQTAEVAAKGKNEINVTLKEDTQTIDEVVVTALGIKRATKALSYNVQEVKSEALTTNKDANFVNSLNGKVAGVTINASSSGVGGASKVVMRGTKSIMQSSNALYVIDGVPMFAATNEGGMEFSSQGTSEPIADINPEDIESMSVLTGAAAAALYGSDAANGAIVITTKKGKEGRLSITVNSNTEISNAFILPRFQTRYGTGSQLYGGQDRSWGDHLNIKNYKGYDPRDDYFQTGIIGTESVSLSTGTDKNQTYASAAAVNAKGIVPNNKYDRYNFTFRNTTKFLKDKMTLDVSAGYIKQKDRNMINQGTYNNPLVGAYLFPRGNDWEEIRLYERYNPARKIYTQYWPVGAAGMTMQNPYWVNYRNLRTNNKDRYMMSASLNYQILDWLSISGRVRLDNSNNDYEEKFFASTNTQLTESSERGLYGITHTSDKQLYADFLININKTFGEDWSLQANFGGSLSDLRSNSLKVRGPIADGSVPGEKVGLTNFFAVQHLSPSKTERLQSGWREQTQSLFASAELGYKSTYYLTLTGRNDWPSQLAGPNSKSKSFFYPSVGFSVVLSELIPNLPQDYLSYIKLRGSFASVGVAFERFLANPHYSWDSATGNWSPTTSYPMYNLKPERTKSYEFGLTMRFLKNFNLDLTYYNTKTMNQTFDPQLGVSGWSSIYIQTGAVRNQGFELSLGYKNTWNNFTWDTGYTFSTNKNKILALADDVINPATGERFSISTLNMGGLGETRFLLKEGGSMGDIYSLIDLRRDDNGSFYIDEKGNIATKSLDQVDDYIKLGSVLPKANMAWRNNFSWKNFNLGFMISARLGGVVFSRTQAMLDSFGVSEVSADARDHGSIVFPNGDSVSPERWFSTVGGDKTIPQYYTYSATNVRLQEASLGYTFPRKMFRNVCELSVSLVGRNLWMIYNKAPFDPESVASTNNFYQGIDYFMMPSQRNIGLNVSLKF